MFEQAATTSSPALQAPDPPNPTFPAPSDIGTTATAPAPPTSASAPTTQPHTAVNTTTPAITHAATGTPGVSNTLDAPTVTPSAPLSSAAPPPPPPQFGHGFDPSIGGDIIMHSTDNILFMCHSTLLRSVSSSFNKMIPLSEIRVGPPYYALSLPHHSSALGVILALLYQRPLPHCTITSFSVLSGCLCASAMYNLDSVTAYLRNILWAHDTYLSITHSPIEAYALGTIFGFEHETTTAFQRCIEVVDLRNTTGINSALSRGVNPGIALPLICRLARRNTIILETLSALHLFPMDLRSPHWWDIREEWGGRQSLVCSTCRSDVVFDVPSWQLF